MNLGNQPALILPNEGDFDPFGGCLDAQEAWRNFGGLSLEKARAKFLERPDIYQEDFMFMGGAAFAFYFPVIEQYLYDASVCPEDQEDLYEVEAVWILAHCIKNQLREPGVKHLHPVLGQISELAAYVRAHLSQYCVDYEEQVRIDQAWEELEDDLERKRNSGRLTSQRWTTPDPP